MQDVSVSDVNSPENSASRTRLLLPAGQICTLSADDGALFLEAGTCEVYALVTGRRVFLGIAQPGTLLVPTRDERGAIAVQPLGECVLFRADLRRLRGAAGDRLIAGIEAWCLLLASGLGAIAKRRPSMRPLTVGNEIPEGRPAAFTAAQGIVWMVVKGQPGRLMDAQEVHPRTPVAIAHSSWLSVSEGTSLLVVDTRAVLERQGLPALLTHAELSVAVAETLMDAGERAALDRIQQRDAAVEIGLQTGLARFRRMMIDNRVKSRLETDCAFVYQTATGIAPSPRALATTTDDFALFAALNDARLRPIPLSGAWQRRDVGPLITERRSDGRLVVLKPDWMGRYRLHVRGERPRRITAALAADLPREAWILTPALPNKPLQVRDIIRSGLSLCSLDLSTMALAVFIASLLGLLMPLATGFLIDTYIPANLRGPTLLIGVALLVAQISTSGLAVAASLLRQRMDGRIAEMIGGGMMDRLMRLPTSLMRTMSSADLAARVAAVDGIRRSVMGVILNALMSGISGLTGIVLLLYYSPVAGAAAMALVALVVAVGVIIGQRQIAAFTQGEQMTANVTSFTHQIIENMPVLRAFAAERRAFARWARNSAEMRSRTLRAKAGGNLFEAFLASYQILAIAVIFAILGFSVGPDAKVSTGGFMVFVSTFQSFLMAGIIVARGGNQLLAQKAQQQQALPLLKNTPETLPQAKDPGDLSGAVEVINLAFKHEDGRQILNGISFTVGPGTFLALVGPSGSGKSTLLSLLVGFEKPTEGSVRYDGRDVAGLDLALLRRQIGYVRQGGRLFAGSLRENIQGSFTADLEDIWRAADIAGIADDIRALPMGMHTVVTEGAAAFSGGQIQRLLLARALMGQPKILLLDEATSALDNVVQAQVSRNIDSLGCTRIVVAHRLSTIRNADVILFLDKGGIVEAGSYADLIARGGPFSHFAKLQGL
jgi:ABC-type bacteriocin/lantibiotic exporter with double-glycine peptidase domain